MKAWKKWQKEWPTFFSELGITHLFAMGDSQDELPIDVLIKSIESFLSEYFIPQFIGRYDTLKPQQIGKCLELLDELWHYGDEQLMQHWINLQHLLFMNMIPLIKRHSQENTASTEDWRPHLAKAHRVLANNLSRQGRLTDALLHHRKAFDYANAFNLDCLPYQTAVNDSLQALLTNQRIKCLLADLPLKKTFLRDTQEQLFPVLAQVQIKGITSDIDAAYHALLECFAQEIAVLYDAAAHAAIAELIKQWFAESLPKLKIYWEQAFKESVDNSIFQHQVSKCSDQDSLEYLKPITDFLTLFKRDLAKVLRYSMGHHVVELRDWFKKIVRERKNLPPIAIDLDDIFRQPTPPAPANIFDWQRTEKKLHRARQKLRDINQAVDMSRAQQRYSQKIIKLIQQLCSWITEHLGAAPCAYELLAIGSLSRYAMQTESDIEVIGLIEKESYRKHPYFASVITLLRAFLASLGEPWLFEEKEKTYILQGLCIDTGQLCAIEQDWGLQDKFFQEPEKLAKNLAATAKKRICDDKITFADTSFYACLAAIPLYGNAHQALTRQYHKALDEHIFRMKHPSLMTIAEHFYCSHYEDYKAASRQINKPVAIKEIALKPLQHWVINSALYQGNALVRIDAKGVYPRTFNDLVSVLVKQGLPDALADLCRYLHNVWQFQRLHQQTPHPTTVLNILYNGLKQALSGKTEKARREYIANPLCHMDIVTWRLALDECKGLDKLLLQQLTALPNAAGECVKTLAEEEALDESLCALGEPVATIAEQPENVSVYLQWASKPEGYQNKQYQLHAKWLDTLIDPETLGIKNRSLQKQTHPVGFLHFQDNDNKEHALHFKEKPDQPMMDYAIYQLRQRLFGHGSPPNILIRMVVVSKHKRRDFPVLVSRTVGQPHDNLAHLFKQKPDLPLRLALTDYYRMVLFDMVTCPGDNAARNFQAVANEKGERTLVCIDNEQYFLRPLHQDLWSKTIQLCSILFCFNEMRPAYDQRALREAFASLQQRDIPLLLKEWLDDLMRHEPGYLTLFTSDERAGLFAEDQQQRRFIASLLLPEGAILHLANTLHYLQSLGSRLTVAFSWMDIIKTLYPGVGDAYCQQLQQGGLNPTERLQRISKTAITTSNQALTACFGKLPDYKKIEAQLVESQLHDYSAARAKYELQTVVFETLEEDSDLSVKVSLTNNAYELGINFKNCLLKPDEQVLLLEKAGQRSYNVIQISDCATLNDALLKNILTTSKQTLQQIALHRCPNISNQALVLIATACPQLNYLQLIGNAGITEIKQQGLLAKLSQTSAIQFPLLKQLHIAASGQLTSICLDGPLLEELKIKALPNLNYLKVNAASLRNLLITDCKNLSLNGCSFNLSEEKANAAVVKVENCSKLLQKSIIANNQKLLLFPLPTLQALEAKKSMEVVDSAAIEEQKPWLRKIVLLGRTHYKSALAQIYNHQRTFERYDIQIGIDFFIKYFLINSQQYKLQLWDTAEQEEFISVIRSYFRGVFGCILFIDMADDILYQLTKLLLIPENANLPYAIVGIFKERLKPALDFQEIIGLICKKNLPMPIAYFGLSLSGKSIYHPSDEIIAPVNNLFNEVFTALLTYENILSFEAIAEMKKEIISMDLKFNFANVLLSTYYFSMPLLSSIPDNKLRSHFVCSEKIIMITHKSLLKVKGISHYLPIKVLAKSITQKIKSDIVIDVCYKNQHLFVSDNVKLKDNAFIKFNAAALFNLLNELSYISYFLFFMDSDKKDNFITLILHLLEKENFYCNFKILDMLWNISDSLSKETRNIIVNGLLKDINNASVFPFEKIIRLLIRWQSQITPSLQVNVIKSLADIWHLMKPFNQITTLHWLADPATKIPPEVENSLKEMVTEIFKNKFHSYYDSENMLIALIKLVQKLGVILPLELQERLVADFQDNPAYKPDDYIRCLMIISPVFKAELQNRLLDKFDTVLKSPNNNLQKKIAHEIWRWRGIIPAQIQENLVTIALTMLDAGSHNTLAALFPQVSPATQEKIANGFFVHLQNKDFGFGISEQIALLQLECPENRVATVSTQTALLNIYTPKLQPVIVKQLLSLLDTEEADIDTHCVIAANLLFHKMNDKNCWKLLIEKLYNRLQEPTVHYQTHNLLLKIMLFSEDEKNLTALMPFVTIDIFNQLLEKIEEDMSKPKPILNHELILKSLLPLAEEYNLLLPDCTQNKCLSLGLLLHHPEWINPEPIKAAVETMDIFAFTQRHLSKQLCCLDYQSFRFLNQGSVCFFKPLLFFIKPVDAQQTYTAILILPSTYLWFGQLKQSAQTQAIFLNPVSPDNPIPKLDVMFMKQLESLFPDMMWKQLEGFLPRPENESSAWLIAYLLQLAEGYDLKTIAGKMNALHSNHISALLPELQGSLPTLTAVLC